MWELVDVGWRDPLETLDPVDLPPLHSGAPLRHVDEMAEPDVERPARRRWNVPAPNPGQGDVV